VTKYQNMNLYVKNIADSVTDEQFKEAFANYGNITSSRVMREANDNKTSKGFGFVCFSTAEEAAKAVQEVNGKLLGGKPLVVTLYQRQEQRRQQLAANFAPQMRFAPGVPVPFPMYQSFPGQPPQRGFPFPPANIPRGLPRGVPAPFNPRAGPGGFVPNPQYMQQPPQFQGYPPRGRPQGAPQGMPRGMPQVPRPIYANAPQMGYPGPQGPGPRGNIKFTAQARNQVPVPVSAGQTTSAAAPAPVVPIATSVVAPSGQKLDFSQALLATADPIQQKNMIGEKLYPLIYSFQPEQAGKITGMLLEMDNAELINLIESPEALSLKIDEALAVLRSHSAE
jgi:polyadenylate-binding protein